MGNHQTRHTSRRELLPILIVFYAIILYMQQCYWVENHRQSENIKIIETCSCFKFLHTTRTLSWNLTPSSRSDPLRFDLGMKKGPASSSCVMLRACKGSRQDFFFTSHYAWTYSGLTALLSDWFDGRDECSRAVVRKNHILLLLFIIKSVMLKSPSLPHHLNHGGGADGMCKVNRSGYY